MARKTVRAIDLDKAIKDVLNEYGDEVYDVMSNVIDDVSTEAVNKLKSVNKFAPNRHPSGAYSASWTKDEAQAGRLGKKIIVHNEKHYRLTHLLEHGHVSRNGTGRTFGRVPAYPHIADVNEWAAKELPKEVEKNLK